jgi:hypothetical protein
MGRSNSCDSSEQIKVNQPKFPQMSHIKTLIAMLSHLVACKRHFFNHLYPLHYPSIAHGPLSRSQLRARAKPSLHLNRSQKVRIAQNDISNRPCCIILGCTCDPSRLELSNCHRKRQHKRINKPRAARPR